MKRRELCTEGAEAIHLGVSSKQHHITLVTLSVSPEQEPGSGSVGGHATCTTSVVNHVGFACEHMKMKSDGLGSMVIVLKCRHRGPA